MNESNAFILTAALTSASKLCCLLQGLRSESCVHTLRSAELFDLPGDRKVNSFRERLEYSELEANGDDEEWEPIIPRAKRTDDEEFHFEDRGFYIEAGRLPTIAERQDIQRKWPNLDLDRLGSPSNLRAFKHSDPCAQQRKLRSLP